jgi:hypothetical protein
MRCFSSLALFVILQHAVPPDIPLYRANLPFGENFFAEAAGGGIALQHLRRCSRKWTEFWAVEP